MDVRNSSDLHHRLKLGFQRKLPLRELRCCNGSRVPTCKKIETAIHVPALQARVGLGLSKPLASRELPGLAAPATISKRYWGTFGQGCGKAAFVDSEVTLTFHHQ